MVSTDPTVIEMCPGIAIVQMLWFGAAIECHTAHVLVMG